MREPKKQAARRYRTSRASFELVKILDEAGPMATGLRARFHRTELWRLRTGRRVAERDTAIAVQKITKGRIPIAWWLEEPRKRAA